MPTPPLPLLYVGLVALLPVSILTTRGGGSAIFYLTLLCAIVAWLRGWVRPGLVVPYRGVLLALAVPLLVVLWAQTVDGVLNGTALEKAGRLGVGLPLILGLLLTLDPRILRQAVWGIMLAGWAATANIVWLVYPEFGRPDTQEYNAVGYGNLMLLMAALTVYTLPWQLTRYTRAEKAFKWVTVVVVFLGFVLTETRTAWLAVPLFVLLAIVLLGERLRHRPWHAVKFFVVIILVLGAAGAANPELRARASAGLEQLHECQHINPTADTSVCIRLQLWRAAWSMFRQHPILGNQGDRLFKTKLHELAKQGLVSQKVAEGYGESHNDMMVMLSSYGLAGGFALLLVYFAPAWLFWRRLTAASSLDQRAAAVMGLAVCLGFAIFGLTEFMFRGMRTMGAYTVFLALFMALSDPRQAVSSHRAMLS